MAQFSFRLDDDIYEQLGQSATVHFRSINSHLQFILVEYLAGEKKNDTEKETTESFKIEL